MFNSATDRLFTLPQWLTVPLAQPVIGCLFSNGGCQYCQCLRPSQNWLPNLKLAGNQDTIPFLSLVIRKGYSQVILSHHSFITGSATKVQNLIITLQLFKYFQECPNSLNQPMVTMTAVTQLRKWHCQKRVHRKRKGVPFS